MKSKYEKQKLSDVFQIINGGTPKRSILRYWDGDIPWISIQDFNDNSRFINSTKEFITVEGVNNSSTNILVEKDIIISARDTVGKLNIIKSPMAFNQSCYGLRTREGIDYLFAYYSTINTIRELKARSYGSVFPTITRSTFDEVGINVFGFCDQLRISGLLGSLDYQIELNNKIIAKLEEQAQAIFKSWFIDFEPFQDGEFVESELGLIPEGWNIHKLGNFFPVITGKKNANIATENGIYPFFTCSKNVLYTDDYSYNANAILLAGNGDFNVKRYNGKFEAYQRTYVLIPKEETYVGLLYNLIKYHLSQIVSGYKGSVINYITKGMIEDYIVALPSNLDRYKINKLFNIFEEEIFLLRRENHTLAQIRDTLLPKLMSGEIDVSNISIDPEEDSHDQNLL